ncbi:hypothetical protein [Teichococcus aestuarii]|uniref:hypothetical protein n=1 Tax=Teichococcus aestuarii TaxID=568898 RepID=UPI0036150CA4
MADTSGYRSVRPHNVGPHDVQKDEKTEATTRRQPEKAYNTEVAEQAAITGANRPEQLKKD